MSKWRTDVTGKCVIVECIFYDYLIDRDSENANQVISNYARDMTNRLILQNIEVSNTTVYNTYERYDIKALIGEIRFHMDEKNLTMYLLRYGNSGQF